MQETLVKTAVMQAQPEKQSSYDWRNQTLLARFCQSAIFRSAGGDNNDGDKEGGGRGKNVPSGFEKILKRTRRGIKHEKADEKSSTDKDEKDSDETEEKKSKDDEDDQDKEDESEDKKKKSEEDKADEESYGQKIYGFFMEPNGGGPNYENWFKLVVLGGIASYYAYFTQTPS